MAFYRHAPTLPPRLWMALAATVIAFVVSLVASLNLYLLEDNNPLTPAAYSTSPLVHLSYDGVYLSALVATVAVCAIIIFAFTQSNTPVVISLVVTALLVALAGFGGLLIRHPTTFLVLFLVFVGLLLISLLSGRAVTTWSRHRFAGRSAALLGACASAGVALLINTVSFMLHTLALNPANHVLFMQGQIGTTHFNFLLIVLLLELLTILIFVVSMGVALRSPSRAS